MEHSRNPNRNPAEVSTAEYFEGQEIPPIEIIVAFGKHVLESDMPQLDDLFPMADIVVLEAFGHTPLHEIVDNEISQGSLMVEPCIFIKK